MKIALMTNNYKPFLGGVPISVERLAEGLRHLGHSVTVFAPTYRGQQEEEGVFRYGTLMNRFRGGVVLPNPLDAGIRRAFREKEFDVIHVHHPMLIGRTAVYLAEKYSIPLVFTYHTRYEQYLSYLKGISAMERQARQGDGFQAKCSEESLHLIQDRLTPAYLKTFLKHCDHVFAPTEGMQRYLEQVCGVPQDRLSVLPTGLEKAQFHPDREKVRALREKYGARGKPLFLTVSRLSHEKNVGFLLESLARLKHVHGREFTLILAGDGPDRETYRRQARQLGLEENTVFAGSIPNSEIPAWFAAADAFLFASQTETQGIVVLESFAVGTPVLAVEATGVSDLVRTGENGVLTPFGQELYAKMLEEFLRGRWDRVAMGENAAKTAQAYREEAVAMCAARHYNEIIANHAVNKSGNRALAYQLK